MSNAPRHGWAHEWDALQNEKDDVTLRQRIGDSSNSLGNELDEAFRRGREYRRKGYSLAQSKAAVHRKNADYRDSFRQGWNWQDARLRKGSRGMFFGCVSYPDCRGTLPVSNEEQSTSSPPDPPKGRVYKLKRGEDQCNLF